MYRWRLLKTIFFFQNGDLSFCLLVNGTVFEDGPQNDVFENVGSKRAVSQNRLKRRMSYIILFPRASIDPFGHRRGSIELKLGEIFYANYFYLTVTLFTPFPLSPFFTANVFLLVSFASLIAFLQRYFAPLGRRGSSETQFTPIRARLVSIISIANWYVLINSALCHYHPE